MYRDKIISRENIETNMQLLIEQLKMEWEHSKASCKRITINLNSTEEMHLMISGVIKKNLSFLNRDNIDFEKVLMFLKENYVLIRMIKKIREKEETAGRSAQWICVDLDREEAELYKKIMKQVSYGGK